MSDSDLKGEGFQDTHHEQSRMKNRTEASGMESLTVVT